MPLGTEVKQGQSFQDGTGLTVKVREIDTNHRVHFSVSEHRSFLPTRNLSAVSRGSESELGSSGVTQKRPMKVTSKAANGSEARGR
jgi:hypothetical protein